MLLDRVKRRRQFRVQSAIAGLLLAGAHCIAQPITTAPLEAPTTAPAEVRRFYMDARPALPAEYHEAPALAKLVSEGKLPPVRQRLPENPVVISPVDTIGRYGGNWRKLAASMTDIQTGFRLGYEPLVRWDRDGKTVVPGLAESWEMHDGGRTFVFHLRKGLRWSDGHPLTSGDFSFALNEILTNSTFVAIQLPWLRSEGQLPTVETPDPFTVIYRFKGAYGNFPKGIAAAGLQHDFFAPRHYLEQFHERFVPKDKLDAMVKKAGFVTWSDFFMQRIDPDRNPDLPTMAPFITKEPYPGSRIVAERNPYYYKIDTAGNQLPYMDRMVTSMVLDPTVLNLKAMNGEADFQIRKIDPSNFTLFRKEGKRLGYRAIVFPSTSPTCIYVSPYSMDARVRPILQDKRFRRALALAINRKELVDLIYTGLAEPSGGFTIPEDPYCVPGMDQANTEYNPDQANALLDEMGLKRRAVDGLRVLPDGKLFSEVLSVYPSEEGVNSDLWQLVADYWREVGLQFTVRQDDGMLSYLQMTSGNTNFFTYLNASLHWDVDGVWKAPISNLSYLGPQYGNYVLNQGRSGVKPSPDMQRLVDWYRLMRSTPDDTERLNLGRQILQQFSDETYVIGICRAPVVAIVSDRMRNVPETFNYDYRLKSPGYLGIEQFYFADAPEAR